MFDYVRELNAVCEELLRSHGDLLERKNIRRKRELIQLIKLDLDKLAHALLEVKDGQAPSVLRSFFGEALPAERRDAIGDRLRDRGIDHVGFEVHEPLDLVVQGIHHWIEQSKKTMGGSMRI